MGENLGGEVGGLKNSVVEMRAEVVAALTAGFDYPGNTVKKDSKD